MLFFRYITITLRNIKIIINRSAYSFLAGVIILLIISQQKAGIA